MLSAARIMSHDVTKFKQLFMAYNMGLVNLRKESIVRAGGMPDDLKAKVERLN